MARAEPGGDAALLRSVAAGDSAALARLYQQHAGALFGYLYRLAGDRMTAEEILQDTRLAVWRRSEAAGVASRISIAHQQAGDGHRHEDADSAGVLEDGYIALTGALQAPVGAG